VGRAGRALRGGERDNRRAWWNDVQSLSRTREQTNRVGSLACIAASLHRPCRPLVCRSGPALFVLLDSPRLSPSAFRTDPPFFIAPCSSWLSRARRFLRTVSRPDHQQYPLVSGVEAETDTAAPYFFYHTSSTLIHDAFDVQRVAMALCASRSESRAVGKPLTSLLRAQAHPGAWTFCSLSHTSIQ
jgi:hypothetical protein